VKLIVVNGVNVTIRRSRINLMHLISIIVRVVEAISNQTNCPDCGCDMDDHDGDFCRNCGEHCEIDE